MPQPIPDEGSVDHSLALLPEGFLFGTRRFACYGTDIFRTRLMLTPATFVRGAGAAEMFYGPADRFTRRGGLPLLSFSLLQDRGSVMALDGPHHHHRKALFLSHMGRAGVENLLSQVRAEWRRRLPAWEQASHVNLFDQMRRILFRATCDWAGVPLGAGEADRIRRDMAEMVEGAGRIGPRQWRAQAGRARTESWARRVVQEAREERPAPEGSPLAALSAHREPDGRPMDLTTAGVELINFIRPTEAVARFVVFAALALHRHPETSTRIQAGDEAYLTAFMQEVRRLTPFIPMIGGRALRDIEWQGHTFRKGDWVLIDLFASNRHPDLWDAPERFRPERFLDREPTLWDLIPQGAGEMPVSHRCPGEELTMALLRMAVRWLAAEIRYDLPPQDLRVDLARIPALPASSLVLRNIARVGG